MLIVIRGISAKTWVALLGTWGGLAVASLLSWDSFCQHDYGSLGPIIDVTTSIASASLKFITLRLYLTSQIGKNESVLASPGNRISDTPSVDYIQGVVVSVQEMYTPIVKKAPGMVTDGTDLVIIHLTSGPESGQEVKCVHNKISMPRMDIDPKPGDKIVVAVTQDFNRKSYKYFDPGLPGKFPSTYTTYYCSKKLAINQNTEFKPDYSVASDRRQKRHFTQSVRCLF